MLYYNGQPLNGQITLNLGGGGADALVQTYTFLVESPFASVVVGYTNAIPVGGFNRTPNTGDVFLAYCISNDDVHFYITAEVTELVDDGNGGINAAFRVLDVTECKGGTVDDTFKPKSTNPQSGMAVAQALEKLSLGLHTDGLLYVFVDGVPVGEGVAMVGGESGDVIGTLDENNNIILSGELADGTYTLKYENADGTYSEIGTLVVAEAPEAEEIINQIPISIDSKGEVYNGTGYKQNTRIKSDGVTEDTVSANTDLTGYIPAVPGDIIRFKNMVLTPTETTGGQYLTMLRLYDSSFAMLKAYSYGNTWNPIEDGGVYTYTVTSDYPDVAYIRVQAQTIDDTSIITVNQEIV